MVVDNAVLYNLPGVDHYQNHPSGRHDFNGQMGALSSLLNALQEQSDAIILLNIGVVGANSQEMEVIYTLFNMATRETVRVVVGQEEGGEATLPSCKSMFANARKMEKRLTEIYNITLMPDGVMVRPRRPKLPVQKFESISGYDDILVHLDGGLVTGLQVSYGNQRHRFEQRIANSSYLQGITILERFSCLQAPIYATAWCIALEEINALEITPKAQALRMVLMELARVGVHLRTIGAMVKSVDYLPGYQLALQLEENLRQVFTTIGAGRYGFGTVRPGGVLLQLSSLAIAQALKQLTHLHELIMQMENFLSRSSNWISRTKGGVLSDKTAIKYGITGANLRASGLNHDQRKHGGIYFYPEVGFKVPLGWGGSSYDRYLVRMVEIEESLKIIQQLLTSLPDGEIMLPQLNLNYSSRESDLEETQAMLDHIHLISKGVKLPAGEVGSVLLEGGDGLVGVDLITSGDSIPAGVNIISPMVSSLQLLSELLIGDDLDEVATTMASLGWLDPGEAW